MWSKRPSGIQNFPARRGPAENVLTETGPEELKHYRLGGGEFPRVGALMCSIGSLVTKGRRGVRLDVPIEIEPVLLKARTGQEVRKLKVLSLGLEDVLRRYCCDHRGGLNPLESVGDHEI